MNSKPTEIVVNKGELIPFDGLVIEGTALVDESAIAGVSTPALVSSDLDRNQVFEGGLVVDGSLKIRSNAKNGKQ